MHTHTSQPRRISPCLCGFAVLAVLGMALFSPGTATAGFQYISGDQLASPNENINFPGTPDGGSPSITYGTWFTNPTGGVPGNVQNPPPFGSLYFNGYGANNTALNLHDTDGKAFIEPIDPNNPNGPHPDMFTFMISATSLTQDSAGKIPVAITGIDFQLDYNNSGNPGTVTFTVFDASGKQLDQSNPIDLKTSGQDPFVVKGDANTPNTIAFLMIQTTSLAPIIDVKHIDITTVANPNVVAVPEPASLTLSAIGSVIGIAAAWRRRNGKAAEGKCAI